MDNFFNNTKNAQQKTNILQTLINILKSDYDFNIIDFIDSYDMSAFNEKELIILIYIKQIDKNIKIIKNNLQLQIQNNENKNNELLPKNVNNISEKSNKEIKINIAEPNMGINNLDNIFNEIKPNNKLQIVEYDIIETNNELNKNKISNNNVLEPNNFLEKLREKESINNNNMSMIFTKNNNISNEPNQDNENKNHINIVDYYQYIKGNFYKYKLIKNLNNEFHFVCLTENCPCYAIYKDKQFIITNAHANIKHSINIEKYNENEKQDLYKALYFFKNNKDKTDYIGINKN